MADWRMDRRIGHDDPYSSDNHHEQRGGNFCLINTYPYFSYVYTVMSVYSYTVPFLSL